MAFKRTAENLWTWKTRFNLKWCVDCYLCCLTSTLRISFCITRWRALWPLMDMFSCCCKVWGSVSSSSFFCSSSCCFCCTTHQASSSELRNLLNAIYTTKQEANKSKIHAKLLLYQGWDKVSIQNAGTVSLHGIMHSYMEWMTKCQQALHIYIFHFYIFGLHGIMHSLYGMMDKKVLTDVAYLHISFIKWSWVYKINQPAMLMKADSNIACCARSVPLPCRALIHICHAVPLPCSDSAVSFVKLRVVAGNIRTASPTV